MTLLYALKPAYFLYITMCVHPLAINIHGGHEALKLSCSEGCKVTAGLLAWS